MSRLWSDVTPRTTPQARARAAIAPLDPGAFGPDQARHLLARIGFGGSPEQVRLVADWGLERSVEYFLNPGEADFRDDTPPREIRDDIMFEPNPEQRQAYRQAAARGDEDALARLRAMIQERQREDRQQARAIQRWWLTRMIESPAALQEKMTLFWHGHFATNYRAIENSWHMLLQNRLFRAHALGSFAELMHAIIRDPAMLAYLDNHRSRRGNPNENLARELMELFALGIGNYTERDIREGARALTGYTFTNNQFTFNQRQHDHGSKQILGVRGNLDGDAFVRAILAQRACASFIAAKLYRFFVAPLPDNWDDRRNPGASPETRSYVHAMGETLRRSGYQLAPVLREVFRSAHFYADEVRGELIKSPAELLVGSIRQLRTPTRDLPALLDAMDLMGQNLLFPPSVAGWPGGRWWINTNTLYTRQNTTAYLLTGQLAGQRQARPADAYDPAPLVRALAREDEPAAREPEALANQLLRFMLAKRPPESVRTIASFIAEHGGVGQAQAVTGAILLITAMPEYQLC